MRCAPDLAPPDRHPGAISRAERPVRLARRLAECAGACPSTVGWAGRAGGQAGRPQGSAWARGLTTAQVRHRRWGCRAHPTAPSPTPLARLQSPQADPGATGRHGLSPRSARRPPARLGRLCSSFSTPGVRPNALFRLFRVACARCSSWAASPARGGPPQALPPRAQRPPLTVGATTTADNDNRTTLQPATSTCKGSSSASNASAPPNRPGSALAHATQDRRPQLPNRPPAGPMADQATPSQPTIDLNKRRRE